MNDNKVSNNLNSLFQRLRPVYPALIASGVWLFNTQLTNTLFRHTPIKTINHDPLFNTHKSLLLPLLLPTLGKMGIIVYTKMTCNSCYKPMLPRVISEKPATLFIERESIYFCSLCGQEQAPVGGKLRSWVKKTLIVIGMFILVTSFLYAI